MATMSPDELDRLRGKMASDLATLIRRKLRDMRCRIGKPRAYRLPKQARMLKSLLAEARDAAPAARAAPSRRRRASAAKVRASARRRPIA